MTRNYIVPIYVRLILDDTVSDERIKKFNHAIIKRWSISGLLYIKNKAWKIVESL